MLYSSFNSLRKPGTSQDGKFFPSSTVAALWNKAAIIPGYDPARFRMDICGAWIGFSDYGNIDSGLGWEIDHIKPVAKGGDDNITNLQPLHWKNNRGKSDNWPNWGCSIKAKT